jgi:pimeloyl-ACP methyl ester carboxylesterase
VVNFRALALIAWVMAGCVHHVRERCPTCTVVDGARPVVPRMRAEARTVFVIVPGALGYGWEWDDAAKALAGAREVDWFVFWWEPWASLRTSARQLTEVLQRTIVEAPPSVKEIVVIAHSVGGMVAAHAAARLRVRPDMKVTLVSIGTPFAGMKALPSGGYDDPLGSPLMIATVGTFRRYPDPAPGVRVISYVTSWPADPVMQPHFGHQPAPPGIGPRGARRIAVDAKEDHNHLVSKIVIDLLQKRTR